MAQAHSSFQRRWARAQRGLTLIEFMVSIAIGMMIVAAMATLIADQSVNRAEVDRSGRMIENGRYALRAITEDLELAGYWGELNGVPTDGNLAALPDPCSMVLADVRIASQLHIQAYDSPVPAAVPACVDEQLTGTDILVVRHADPDFSSLSTGGLTDLSKIVPGQYYVQTGLNSSATSFTYAVNVGSATATTNETNFPLVKKDKTKLATLRKMVVRIYYVAKCSVEVDNSCTNGDNGNPIPTLKMIELSASGGLTAWSAPVTIAEGIEQFQVDYGRDTNGDGAPDGDNVNGSALTHTDTADVMAVTIHLVARALEKSSGFSDGKKYALGTHGEFIPGAGDLGYKRHAFVQSVRLVNPSGRRQP